MRYVSFIFIVSVFLFACKPSGKSAAQYNNTIVKYQTRIGALQDELFTVFRNGNSMEMLQVLDKLRYELRVVSDSVAIMPVFDGRDDFKRGTVHYVDQLKNVVDGECVEILKLYQLPDSAYTATNEKRVQELIFTVNDKTAKALAELKKEQQKFATEYNFEISN